jgi:hypothetical protein
MEQIDEVVQNIQEYEPPHAVIEPSALRAAKAPQFE